MGPGCWLPAPMVSYPDQARAGGLPMGALRREQLWIWGWLVGLTVGWGLSCVQMHRPAGCPLGCGLCAGRQGLAGRHACRVLLQLELRLHTLPRALLRALAVGNPCCQYLGCVWARTYACASAWTQDTGAQYLIVGNSSQTCCLRRRCAPQGVLATARARVWMCPTVLAHAWGCV